MPTDNEATNENAATSLGTDNASGTGIGTAPSDTGDNGVTPSSTEGSTPGNPSGATWSVTGRWTRFGVLTAVFVCAAAGLVYQLALVALGSYLVGSSVTQAALVISVAMCAMGIGAVAAKRLIPRPAISFVVVELLLAVVGGFAVPALYAAFAWLSVYTPAMLVFAVLIGILIGAEVPLLMELLQGHRAQGASSAVADITAVVYVGALVGGLEFPLLLLPTLGLLVGTLAVAAVNVAAAWIVGGWFFRRLLPTRTRIMVTIACLLVLAMLASMAVASSRFELTARQALYRDPIVHAERSDYQEIVLTQGHVVGPRTDDFRMFLDGDLQFSSIDEYRYHESLVHPAMVGNRDHVLVLGAGDGLALREVLRYPDVEQVTLVDLDPEVVRLARENPRLREMNDEAFEDPRVDYVPADAFTWVRDDADQRYDAIIADFPDPDTPETGKLFSVEMYTMLRGLLDDGGRIVAQGGSPFFAPKAFWSVHTTIAEAGLRTLPYHVSVPSFGDWGFVLATDGGGNDQDPKLSLPRDHPSDLRFVTDQVLQAAQAFPPDRIHRDVEASTLLHPVIVEYQREGWISY